MTYTGNDRDWPDWYTLRANEWIGDIPDYSALASKWEFEQMGIWPQNSLQVIREQMGIRANGNVPRKNMQNDGKWEHFLSNETVLSTQTLQNTKMGSQFLCNLFASKWELEQMGMFLEFLVIGH